MVFDSERDWFRTWLAHWTPPHAIHQDTARGHEVYQRSTMSALLDGVFDGDTTVAELLTHGDFGLGTFNRLDGEMVILDGVCHRLRSDGSVHEAKPTDRTPFATVTWFRADRRLELTGPLDRHGLIAAIDDELDSPNVIYALRVEGDFDVVHTRTVREQRGSDAKGLAEATRDQAETVLTHTCGTLAGFRMPAYEQGVSVAGYHLHYLDRAHTQGGHALDFTIRDARVDVSVESELHLSLPTTPNFLDANLDRTDVDADVRAAEGG